MKVVEVHDLFTIYKLNLNNRYIVRKFEIYRITDSDISDSKIGSCCLSTENTANIFSKFVAV